MNPWDAHVSVPPELVATLLRNQFPMLEPKRIAFAGEGWDNFVYEINDTLIFRFPRRDVAVSCLQAENLVLPQIATLDFAHFTRIFTS